MAVINETLYTVEEIANLLGVHPETVRKRIKDGYLRATNLGGAAGYRIALSSLARSRRKHPGVYLPLSFSVEEVAEWLKIQPETVLRWIHHEGLSATYLNSHEGYCIPQPALDQFLRERQDGHQGN